MSNNPQPSFVERVAAQTQNLKPLRALLWLIALPFYLLGWVLALIWIIILYIFGAVKLGMLEARNKLDKRPVVVVVDENVAA